MIKFKDWTFDFKNMKAVDHNGVRYHLMKLNNEFYVRYDINVNLGEQLLNRSLSWHWPKFKYDNNDGFWHDLELYSSKRNKELTELYMTWCIEQAIFTTE